MLMAKIYKHISAPAHSVPAKEALGIAPDAAITEGLLESIMHERGLTGKMNTKVGSLIVEENLWDVAMSLSRSDNNQTAFRASWGLEWAYCIDPKEIESRSEQFFEDLMASGNQSVHRVYSKMLCDMTRRGTFVLTDSQAGRLAERCFDLLIGAETPVAVKVWQIELLSDLMERIGWIEEQLTPTIRAISEDSECTPGMAACARHYFARLAKRKKSR